MERTGYIIEQDHWQSYSVKAIWNSAVATYSVRSYKPSIHILVVL